MASFEAALAAGADAVYLALPRFGARAYAANFTMGELKAAIAQAKLHNMKVYVTMNTILFEDEVEEAFQQVVDVYEAGADALIVQDLGLIHLIHHRLPEMKVHASTQLSVNRPEQMDRLKKLGVTRVVLARECSLEQIRQCAARDMETEVFVHGALCISWSGQCQFSAVRYDRSGNRGQCAQACRMEYDLTEDGKTLPTKGHYLLSPKDLSVLGNLDALKEMGVDSFKIEGRMKSPLYVYESVLAARKQVLDKSDRLRLAAAFSRGFTPGHFTHTDGRHLMNFEAGNHQGIELGTVIGGTKDRVTIKLDRDLHQEDGLRFVWDEDSAGSHANFIWNEKGKLTSFMPAGKTAQVPASRYIPKGAKVRLTLDAARTKEVRELIGRTRRRQTIEADVLCKGPGYPLVLKAGDIIVESAPVSAAQKRPADAAMLREHLEKKSADWGVLRIKDVQLTGDIFINVKEINELRRHMLDKLEKEITRTPKAHVRSYEYKAPAVPQLRPVYVSVQKPDQIASDAAYYYSEFPLKNVHKKAAIYEEVGEFCAHLGNGKIVEGLNVSNSYGVAALLEMGYKGVVLSSELSEERACLLASAYEKRYGHKVPAIMPVYEKRRLMLMDYCPVNTVKKDGQRQDCHLCRMHRYELKGKDGSRQWLYGDPHCRMQVFDVNAQNRLDEMEALHEAGIDSFLVRMSDEDEKTSGSVISETLTITHNIEKHVEAE